MRNFSIKPVRRLSIGGQADAPGGNAIHLFLYILSIHAYGGQALLNHKDGQATGAPRFNFMPFMVEQGCSSVFSVLLSVIFLFF